MRVGGRDCVVDVIVVAGNPQGELGESGDMVTIGTQCGHSPGA